MPPTLTPQQSNEDLAQSVRFGLATAETPQQVSATPSFSMEVPETIPSTTLRSPATFNDVITRRRQAEQDQLATQQLGTDYDALLGRINTPVGATPFANPEQFLNNLLLNRPSETQAELDQTRQGQSDTIRSFAGDFREAGTEARDEFGVADLTTELQNTRTRIADRTKRLREDLRNFEVNAENRGVAREFVQGAKQKLQADATAELADLAIIEAAQTGNLQLANDQVDQVLQEKLQAFEFENAAIQAEIQRLEAIDTRESERRSEQLQIALQERTRNIETALQNEKEKRQYMIEAASNGADQGTLDAIRNASTPGEAALLAGPFVGRLDRLQAEANITNTYSAINSRNLNDTLALAEKGDQAAIDKLGFDPRSTTGNFEAESSLRKEFNGLKTVEQATQVQQSFNQINSAYQGALQAGQDKTSKAAADQALVISFNKMLDPGSVVREGEFARSTEGQSLINRWKGKADAVLNGGVGLTDQDRAAIVNLTRDLYADYVQGYNDKAFEFRQNAARQGGDPDYVAGYMDTIGLTAQNAPEGAVIFKNGVGYMKQGDQMVQLEI